MLLVFLHCLERQGLRNRERVSKLQEVLIQSLQNQISANHPNEGNLFPRLLMIISNLRELSVEHKRLLSTLRNKPEFSKDMQTEFLGLPE